MTVILTALGFTYLVLGWSEGQMKALSESADATGRNIQVALLYCLGWLYIAYGLTVGH